MPMNTMTDLHPKMKRIKKIDSEKTPKISFIASSADLRIRKKCRRDRGRERERQKQKHRIFYSIVLCNVLSRLLFISISFILLIFLFVVIVHTIARIMGLFTKCCSGCAEDRARANARAHTHTRPIHYHFRNWFRCTFCVFVWQQTTTTKTNRKNMFFTRSLTQWFQLVWCTYIVIQSKCCCVKMFFSSSYFNRLDTLGHNSCSPRPNGTSIPLSSDSLFFFSLGFRRGLCELHSDDGTQACKYAQQ